MAPSFGQVAVWTSAVKGVLTTSNCRCTDMSSSCWPGEDSWVELNVSVVGHLVTGIAAASPVAVCSSSDASSDQCELALNRSKSTEFWNMKYSGGFQSTGLQGGFSTRPSEYAVVAHSTDDVRHAVNFARDHNLRLVVKGAGHDYMGRNTAPTSASLLIATFPMLGIHWAADNNTVTVEAGVTWQDVYMQAQARGRYVQGGHCPSVGAAGGFSLGAGFGPMSRMYGTGADNMVAATVIAANGDVLHADEAENADLFWALRGGGGGTFGIVTNITYKTHVAPSLGGYVHGSMVCQDASSFEQLLVAFLQFIPKLFTPHWGDSATPNALTQSIDLSLLYVGLTEEEARAIWQPWIVIMDGLSACSWKAALSFLSMPMIRLPSGEEFVRMYPYAGAHYPHTGDPTVDGRLVDGFLGQINQWSFGQAHRYILQEDILQAPGSVARKLVNLTSFPTTYRVLQFSKALAGGSSLGGNVSTNALVRKAGVALMGNEHVANYFPHLPETRQTLLNFIGSMDWFWSGGFCHSSGNDFAACLTPAVQTMNESEIQACWSGVHRCFQFRSEQFHQNYTVALRSAFPTGSYINEGDYFEPDWQHMFWGDHYPSLRAVKVQVDPQGLFVCHHCVGSEEWTQDGNCRLGRSRLQQLLI